MDDRTRCDCLTRSHAVEFDFASKWAEALGQSLYYSHKTGKKAGIVLILEDKKKDRKYLSRLEQTIKGKDLQIKVWTVEKAFVSKKEEEKSICFIASADEAIWQMPSGGFAEGFCLLTAAALFAVIRFLMICSKPIPFGILFAYGFNLLNLHIRKIHFPEFSSDVSQEPFFSDAGRPVICILPGKNHTERYWFQTLKTEILWPYGSLTRLQPMSGDKACRYKVRDNVIDLSIHTFDIRC